MNAHMPLRIFVALDTSDVSRDLLKFVRDVAPIHSVVRIVNVAPGEASVLLPGDAAIPVPEPSRDDRKQPGHDARDALPDAADFFANAGIPADTQTIEMSWHDADIGHAIVAAAAAWRAELVVVGARQHRQWLRWLEASVSGALTRLSPCPLMIVPQGWHGGEGEWPARMLFAVDSAEDARHCAMYGLRFAAPNALSLRAVCVAAPAPVWPAERRETDVDRGAKALAAARQVLERASINVTTATIGAAETSEDIARALVREAAEWHADLLVMGMHGSQGLKRLVVGSVASEVAHLARTPLLLVDVPDVPDALDA
ncbi:UspA domain-containing protein [Paraburkholderia sacchari]|uniref:universal stress protein n=1 Tax=Paraburkholderia sacchari TaxID=159450 RepID=UPI0039A5C5E4